MWILNEWSDIEADALTFFHIDDLEGYPDSAKGFRLIYRLPHYKGVLRSKIEIAAHEREQRQQVQDTPPQGRVLTNPKKVDENAFFFNNGIPVERVPSTETSYLVKHLEGE